LVSRLEVRTEPKAEVRRQEAEAERNKPVTFGEYAKDWMDGHVSTNLKPSTKRGYESLLDKRRYYSSIIPG
jgi:hypothetical protein